MYVCLRHSKYQSRCFTYIISMHHTNNERSLIIIHGILESQCFPFMFTSFQSTMLSVWHYSCHKSTNTLLLLRIHSEWIDCLHHKKKIITGFECIYVYILYIYPLHECRYRKFILLLGVQYSIPQMSRIGDRNYLYAVDSWCIILRT